MLALLWWPLLAIEGLYPYDARHILPSPVLQKLLGLAGIVAVVVLISLTVLSVLGTRAAMRLASRSGIPPGLAETVVGIIASVIVLSAHGQAHAWARAAGLSSEGGLALLLIGAAVSSTVLVTTLLGLVRKPRASVMLFSLACASILAWLVVGYLVMDLREAGLRLGVPVAGALALGVACAAMARVLDPRTIGPKANRWSGVLGLGLPALALVLPVFFVNAGAHTVPAHTSPRTSTNVVIFMIDTMRADHTALAGYTVPTTPNLKTASTVRATTFTQATAGAPSTMPSVKTLFTGLAASTWGLKQGNRPPPPSATTIAEIFHANGYATAAFSANGIIDGPGFREGFERFWSASGFHFFRASFLLRDLLGRNSIQEAFQRLARLRAHKVRGETARKLARGWLEDQAERPFFLYLHVLEPHWPYHDQGYGFIPDRLRNLEKPYFHADLQRFRTGAPSNAALRETPELEEMVARYDEEIRKSDDVLGATLRDLKELGLDGSTLVIIVADHGEEFFDHNGFGHGHDVYQETVHVPLLFLWPDGSEYDDMPAIVDHPVSLLDIRPTLVDYLGLDGLDAEVDGNSLRSHMEDPDHDLSAGVIAEAFLPGKLWGAYREGSLKARFRYDRTSPRKTTNVRVFDLSVDPQELVPVGRDESGIKDFVDRARTALQARWTRAKKAE
jgi:arylsulfatase A-like enzyme